MKNALLFIVLAIAQDVRGMITRKPQRCEMCGALLDEGFCVPCFNRERDATPEEYEDQCREWNRQCRDDI